MLSSSPKTIQPIRGRMRLELRTPDFICRQLLSLPGHTLICGVPIDWPLVPASHINMLSNHYALPMPTKTQTAHFVMINSIVNQTLDGIYQALFAELLQNPKHEQRG